LAIALLMDTRRNRLIILLIHHSHHQNHAHLVGIISTIVTIETMCDINMSKRSLSEKGLDFSNLWVIKFDVSSDTGNEMTLHLGTHDIARINPFCFTQLSSRRGGSKDPRARVFHRADPHKT
jgi:hypothetical protein